MFPPRLHVFLITSALVAIACEKLEPHEKHHGTTHASSAKAGDACAGAPEDRSSQDFDIYEASRRREESGVVYKYAVARYGKPTGCTWEGLGSALDRVYLRDKFVFTFPGGHHLENFHEGPVKRTTTLEVDSIPAGEAMNAIHGFATGASVDWAQAVHSPARRHGLDRTAFFQDDGKCSFGFYTKGGPEVVRLEQACGE